MVFDQARVIGNSQPGGTVGPGRMPNLHYNPNDRNQTSLRNSVITLQTEMQDLARRVADRMVADPSSGFTEQHRFSMFENDKLLDFGLGTTGLVMTNAEKTRRPLSNYTRPN
jgi:hypothetical protein